jgi:hypothetical protein
MHTISFYKGPIDDCVPEKHIMLEEAVSWLRLGQFKEKIDKLRSLKDIERKVFKRSLPYFSFGGKFNYRSKEGLEQPSNLLCIDLDHIPSEAIYLYKGKISSIPFVKLVFTSPSGDGLKIIVEIPSNSVEDNPLRYQACYKEICKLIDLPLEFIDSSTKDICRACFVSYDPNLYYNFNSEIFLGIETKVIIEKQRSMLKIIPPSWTNDFLFRYALENELPSPRHPVIEKNMAVLFKQMHPKVVSNIKEKYLLAQRRERDTFVTWEEAQDKGQYIEFSTGELVNYIRNKKLDYEMPFNQGDIVFIDGNKPFSSLKQIIRKDFEERGFIKFYINKSRKLECKLIGKLGDCKYKVVLAEAMIKKDGDTFIKFVDDSVDLRQAQAISKVVLECWVWRVVQDDSEYFILTPEEIDSGNYIIEGMEVNGVDKFILGEQFGLKTQKTVIIANTVSKAIPNFKNFEDLQKRISYDNFEKSILSKRDRQVSLKLPHMFKQLILAAMVHQEFDGYPLHILTISKPHVGKTYLFNAVADNVDEKVFSGSLSTIKGLIPSFKGSIVKPGKLLESQHFCFIDEFFNLVTRSRNNQEDQRDNDLGSLKELLEHQDREFSSGNSKGLNKAKMSARIIAASNFLKNGYYNTVKNICKNLDNAFLSRWLIFVLDDKIEQEMLGIIEKEDMIPFGQFKLLKREEIIEACTLLQSLKSKLDRTKFKEILEKALPHIPAFMGDEVYRRYRHHAECLLDGLVKLRCWKNNDIKLEAIAEDYNEFENIWLTMIKSWEGVETHEVSAEGLKFGK